VSVRVFVRSRSAVFVALILVGCSSCSYEAKRKTETAVEQAVEKFHEELNAEEYQQIYSEADAELRGRATEAEFTAQLGSAHEQLGRTSGKAYVFIDESVWRGLRQAFGAKREIVSHGNSPVSDLIIGHEQFVWAVENDQPKLVSYKLQRVCSKPCAAGFGPP
jgi:hypothetical protein